MKVRAALIVLALMGIILSGEPRQAQRLSVYLPLVMTHSLVHGAGSTYDQCNYLQQVGAKWYYDWGPMPSFCPGIEAVPMIWSTSQAGQPLGGNSLWVMWFNECSQVGQCNKAPQVAAATYNANLDKYPGKQHVAPNECDLYWASLFLSQVMVKPQALGVHLYVWEPLEQALERTRITLDQAVGLAQRNGIREIWLTEWAALPGYMGQEEAQEYMRRVFAEVLPDYPTITRQAWFQVSYRGDERWAFGPSNNTSLVEYASGQLTPFGRIYREQISQRTLNPLWDERADVNRDENVNILDLVIVAGKFGQRKYIGGS